MVRVRTKTCVCSVPLMNGILFCCFVVCAFGGDALAVGTVMFAVWSSQYAKVMQLGWGIDSKTVNWARIHIQICGELSWRWCNCGLS